MGKEKVGGGGREGEERAALKCCLLPYLTKARIRSRLCPPDFWRLSSRSFCPPLFPSPSFKAQLFGDPFSARIPHGICLNASLPKAHPSYNISPFSLARSSFLYFPSLAQPRLYFFSLKKGRTLLCVFLLCFLYSVPDAPIGAFLFARNLVRISFRNRGDAAEVLLREVRSCWTTPKDEQNCK